LVATPLLVIVFGCQTKGYKRLPTPCRDLNINRVPPYYPSSDETWSTLAGQVYAKLAISTVLVIAKVLKFLSF